MTTEDILRLRNRVEVSPDSDTDSDTNSDTISTDSDTNSDTDSDTLTSNSGTDSDTNSDTDSDTISTDSDTDSDTRGMELSPKQKDILDYCSVPRSSREILERAGISYHSKNIQTYITSLVEAGYLEMTNPDNPKASNQKYKKK